MLNKYKDSGIIVRIIFKKISNFLGPENGIEAYKKYCVSAEFYILLFIVEMYLMIHFARKGPSSLGLGKYHFEQSPQSITADPVGADNV